jgi:tRNA pseudouridine38-40 synthase
MSLLPRLAFKLEYDGAKFCGSQLQAGVRTVQEELEKALAVLAKQPVRASFAGRTDSGVHANGQVAHCDWPVEDFINDDIKKLCASINGILSRDVVVVAAQVVPDDFHARFSATGRNYAYKILNRNYRSPLLQHRSYHVPGVPVPLNLGDMLDAIPCLEGEHDFSAFKSSHSDLQNAVCQVRRAEILNLGEGVLEFRIEADRFVYNMVRVIAGTLVEIGLGKRPVSSLLRALESKDRREAGPTAPACGLCLTQVQYPEAYHLFKPFSESPVSTKLTSLTQESA